ncbi:MAG: cardiolipin synthase [Gemmatimonadetes bacterium]|nr:cardiolipin synthase [Gemmatimonadota bacterium]
MNWALFLVFAEWLVRIGVSARVISRRTNVSESLAWMGLILLFPFAGTLLYLWFGEALTGRRRSKWMKRVRPVFERWLLDVAPRTIKEWADGQEEERALSTMVLNTVGVPALPGNRVTLIASATAFVDALVVDIAAAKRACYLEFYIWEEGGVVDRVVDALLEAAGRGVDCRVLVDDVGSRGFLRTRSGRKLREGGVQVFSGLPVGILQARFRRWDLRLHRKIVVIDEDIGYTGSQNMADPSTFKKEKGVGQWIDAMVRVEGEAAEALLVTFLSDWQLETGSGIEQLERAIQATPIPSKKSAIVQVIPTGPTLARDVAKQILINAIYGASGRLVLTTPYYVPDENLQLAMLSAARRGVEVTLIVPEKVDSRLVHFASAPYLVDLIEAGVKVQLYQKGLLHTKSITVDERYSLFGSLNLDARSLHLNFEITVAVYDRAFTRNLRGLQLDYLADSQPMVVPVRPSFGRRMIENAVRLLAPLL